MLYRYISETALYQYPGGGVGILGGSILGGTVANAGLIVLRGRSIGTGVSVGIFVMTGTWVADIDTFGSVIDVLLTIGANVGVTIAVFFSVVVAHPAIIVIDIISRTMSMACFFSNHSDH